MKTMIEINLQNKAECLKGKIEHYWFENPHIGLSKTQFHRIEIPLTPFESELEYDDQPLETVIMIDWLKLGLVDPLNLDGVTINHDKFPDVECTIYVGCSHTPCDIRSMKLEQVSANVLTISGTIDIDFEHEGVAQNESFSFNTKIESVGEFVNKY